MAESKPQKTAGRAEGPGVRAGDKVVYAHPDDQDKAVIEELRAENERLRAELAEAKADAKARPNTRPQPAEPSFGLSEGERAEMETLRHRREQGDDVPDTVTSPFTGRERSIDQAK